MGDLLVEIEIVFSILRDAQTKKAGPDSSTTASDTGKGDAQTTVDKVPRADHPLSPAEAQLRAPAASVLALPQPVTNTLVHPGESRQGANEGLQQGNEFPLLLVWDHST